MKPHEYSTYSGLAYIPPLPLTVKRINLTAFELPPRRSALTRTRLSANEGTNLHNILGKSG